MARLNLGITVICQFIFLSIFKSSKILELGWFTITVELFKLNLNCLLNFNFYLRFSALEIL